MIFVFGSNESGIHGAGAARFAKSLGAVHRVGFGIQGETFAIPTKDWMLYPLELNDIHHYVKAFIRFARINLDSNFKVTRIGCGLAGYKDEDIAPMFLSAPDNCHFDKAWEPYLVGKPRNYWGTM